MKHEFAYEEAQRHLRQRNRFAALAAVLGLTSLIAVGAAHMVGEDGLVALLEAQGYRVTRVN